MSKKITLLGSTGSIGTQSLDVIRAQGYEVFGLSAHRHVDKILQQIEEFHPKYVCLTDPDAAARLDAALSGRAGAPKLLTGPEGLRELAALDGLELAQERPGGKAQAAAHPPAAGDEELRALEYDAEPRQILIAQMADAARRDDAPRLLEQREP